MKSPHDIILRPILTEKSYDQIEEGKYSFFVDIKANKSEIKRAIEEIFDVKVEKVNTMRQQGKLKRQGMFVGRRPSTKKAIVRLTPDSKAIEFFEGMA